MKSSKERKMDRKAKHKALAVEKTVKSRQRRLDNKAKRDEIHAINPDMKVRVINQVTHDEDGAEIKIENGKIVKWLPQANPVPEMIIPLPNMEQAKQMGEEIIEVFNAEIEEVKAGKTDSVGKLQKLVNKWRSK